MNTNLSKSNCTIAGIHYTTNHTAKMKGVVSLSTDINSNPICQGRAKVEGSICAKCYASRMFDDNKGTYRKANKAFKQNTEILCNRLLNDDEIPTIDPNKFPLFRGQSFSDYSTEIEVLNTFKIAEKNPSVSFAMFTKNPGFFRKALKVAPKPKNVQIVLSSMRLNVPANGEIFGFVDKVFTVYDPETIETKGVQINCGAKSCFSCRRCYKPNPDGVKVQFISEKLK